MCFRLSKENERVHISFSLCSSSFFLSFFLHPLAHTWFVVRSTSQNNRDQEGKKNLLPIITNWVTDYLVSSLSSFLSLSSLSPSLSSFSPSLSSFIYFFILLPSFIPLEWKEWRERGNEMTRKKSICFIVYFIHCSCLNEKVSSLSFYPSLFFLFFFFFFLLLLLVFPSFFFCKPLKSKGKGKENRILICKENWTRRENKHTTSLSCFSPPLSFSLLSSLSFSFFLISNFSSYFFLTFSLFLISLFLYFYLL